MYQNLETWILGKISNHISLDPGVVSSWIFHNGIFLIKEDRWRCHSLISANTSNLNPHGSLKVHSYKNEKWNFV